MVRWIEVIVAVLTGATVFHALITGRMRVKGAGVYSRDENPGGYWFMVASHSVVVGILAYMAWAGIPP